eukprot:1469256-Pyramimonas_sp.AAC.1
MGPKSERRIPEFIFLDPRYREKLAALLAAADIRHLPAVLRWQYTKGFMWEAARETRNELQGLPLTSQDPHALEARM